MEEIDVDVGEPHCGERVQGRKPKGQSPFRTAVHAVPLARGAKSPYQ